MSRQNEIGNFSGIDDPYYVSNNPKLSFSPPSLNGLAARRMKAVADRRPWDAKAICSRIGR